MNKIHGLRFICYFCILATIAHAGDIEVRFPSKPDDVYYNPFAGSAKGSISLKENLVKAGEKARLSFRLHDVTNDESRNWTVELGENQTSTPVYLFVFNEDSDKPSTARIRLDLVKDQKIIPPETSKVQILFSRIYENTIWKCPAAFHNFRIFINTRKKFSLNEEFSIFRISEEFTHENWSAYNSHTSNLSNKSKVDYVIYLKIEKIK